MGTNSPSPEETKEIEIIYGSARCRINAARGGLVTSWVLPRAGKQIEVVSPPNSSTTTGWPDGGIPLLFPFAGRVWDQSEVGFYRTNDGRFPMDMHGFLYDQELVPEILSAAKIRLTGSATMPTKAKYPWNWELEVVAELLNSSSLQLSIHVRHVGSLESPMPIAMGVHPFWRHTFESTADPKRIPAFRPAAQLFRQVEDGRAGREQVVSPTDSMPLTDPRLRSGIFSKLTKSFVEFDLPDQGSLISEWSQTSGIQHLVLWSNPQAGYFCPEPWMGLPDAVHAQTGCLWLNSGESHTCQFTFRLLENKK